MLTLNFTKFPVLETERLILREHDLADAETLFAMRTNETVMKYIDRERPKDIFEIKTDEDIFKALPDEAITIKIGSNLSEAKYYLTDHKEVRKLLWSLVN